MTPKEKASEIFEKFYLELREHKGYYDYETSRECSLIAVDEILNKDGYNNDFWNKVKKEIKFLNH